MDDPSPDRDPGWPPLSWFLSLLVPFLAARRSRHQPPDGLVVLRMAFTGLALACWVYLLTLLFIELEPQRDDKVGLCLVVMLAAAALAVTLAATLTPRTPTTTMEQAAQRFRTQMFVRIGLTESVVVWGLAATFVTGRLWFYLLGMVLGWVPMLLLAAPTRGRVAGEAQRLMAAGIPGSFVAELRRGRPAGG